MKNINRILLLGLLLANSNLVFLYAVKYKKSQTIVVPPVPIVATTPTVTLPPVVVYPQTKVENTNPGYLSYAQINQQLRKWEEEARDLVDIGTYGSSANGQPLTYVKITNELDKKQKPKILITGCIHGNEPLSTGVIMNYLGLLLKEYDMNSILNKEEIFFIPVVSPDSYPRSRHVEGCDPNRDFENKETIIVNRLQEFHLKEKFKAVISAHTFGRIYLIPWGEKTQLCPDHDSYKKIVGEMANLSNYRLLRACEIYGTPIIGGELDWFYKNGAFVVVFELGTHQKIPTKEEIDYERNRTWKSFLLFLEEAPKVKA